MIEQLSVKTKKLKSIFMNTNWNRREFLKKSSVATMAALASGAPMAGVDEWVCEKCGEAIVCRHGDFVVDGGRHGSHRDV